MNTDSSHAAESPLEENQQRNKAPGNLRASATSKRISRVLLGTVSDSSNPLTRGELSRTQTDYLDFISKEVGWEVVRQSVSHQDSSIREFGLGGFVLWTLMLEILSRRENERHSQRDKGNPKQRNVSAFYRWLRLYGSPIAKFWLRSYRERLRRLKAIETVVSDKHLFLWTSIVEGGLDGGIIFEADFDPPSPEDWKKLPAQLESCGGNFDYIDFSASFPLEKLSLASSRTAAEFEFLTTNTLCAYWISADAASAALLAVARRPWLRAIGADFLLNSVNFGGGGFRSRLNTEPLVGHKSMKNRATSTIGTM